MKSFEEYCKENGTESLLNEWDYERNLSISPKHVSYGSHQKIAWKCNKGHQWEAILKDRIRGNGCPYCSGKALLIGETDLATVNPNVASEWNFEKNGSLRPEMFFPNSNKKVWWKCEQGHEWEAIIASRNKGRNCPYCTGNKVLAGFNDFASKHPELLSQWDYEKNELLPEEVFANTNKKMWWRCSKGHSYEMALYNRIKSESGCPYCSNRKLLKGFNDVLTTNPELAKQWDYEKNKLTPEEVYSGNTLVWWKCNQGHEWRTSINTRRAGNGCPYCTNQKVLVGYNDLSHCDPETAKYWNYKRNGNLTPSSVLYGGRTSYWWICDKGHEWRSIIYKNTVVSCPICNGRKLLTGYNDLLTKNPSLAMEYDEKKNHEPANKILYAKASHRKYWWKCNLGHSYQASLNNKIIVKSGCPYCANQKTLAGFNDILSDPQKAIEWNYSKNVGIDPETINVNSMQTVWWKCKKGHEWQMSPYGKKGCPICNMEKRSSLPEKIMFYYAKQYFHDAVSGYTCSTLKRKELDIFIPSKKTAVEYDGWHYHRDVIRDKNKDEICNSIGIKLFRIREPKCPVLDDSYSICVCLTDNSYEELERAIIYILRANGVKDPYVNIQNDMSKILELAVQSEKKNSLQDSRPELMSEWDYSKNGDLLPNMVHPTSTKVVWWKCPKGHSYKSRIEDKTHKRNGCPICANRRVLVGYNDLESCNSELAKEFASDLNGNISPSEILYGGTKKYWWRCPKGHEWETSTRVRIRGSGCPYCGHRILLKGYNDFATTNPQLAAEWHPLKNGSLKPDQVFGSSGQKVWWRCRYGHEWKTSLNDRARGTGCPFCYKQGRKQERTKNEN